MSRVSTDDLDFAHTWLLAYEGDSGTPIEGQDPTEDDEQQARLRRVAAWIDAEIENRKIDAIIRDVAARTGGKKPTREQVRLALADTKH